MTLRRDGFFSKSNEELSGEALIKSNEGIDKGVDSFVTQYQEELRQCLESAQKNIDKSKDAHTSAMRIAQETRESLIRTRQLAEQTIIKIQEQQRALGNNAHKTQKTTGQQAEEKTQEIRQERCRIL